MTQLYIFKILGNFRTVARHIFVASAGPLEAYTLSTANGSPHCVIHIVKVSPKKHLADVHSLLRQYHLALTFSHYTITPYSSARFRMARLSRGIVQHASPVVIKVSPGRYLHTLLLAFWVPAGSIRLTNLPLGRSRKKVPRPFPIYLVISILVQLFNLCDYLHSCNIPTHFPWQIFLDSLTLPNIWLTPSGYIKLTPNFCQLISGQYVASRPRKDNADGLQVLLHRVGVLCLEILSINRKVVLKFPTVSEFYATICHLQSLIAQEMTNKAKRLKQQLIHYYMDASQIDCFISLLRALANPFAISRIDSAVIFNTMHITLQPVFNMQMGISDVDSKGVTRYMRALETRDLAQARILLHIEGLHRDSSNMTALHRLALNISPHTSEAYWSDLVCSLNLDTLNAIDNDGQFALRYLWLNGFVPIHALINISQLSSSAIYLTDISASTINQILCHGTRRCIMKIPSYTTVCLPISQHVYTPLMYAALNGLEQAVSKLVPKYAGAITGDGSTAGTLAMQRGYSDIADYLAKHELVRMPNGQTMLQSLLVTMASEENFDVLTQLANDAHQLLHMASSHALFTGDTALIIASRQGLLTKARLLGMESLVSLYELLLSVETGLVNDEQYTALMCVCRSDKTLHSECMALIRAGEAGMRTHTGVTALMYASQRGFIEFIRLLLPYEGGCCSAAGETALELSAFTLNRDAVSIIMRQEGPEHATGVISLLIAACGRGQFSRIDLSKVQDIVMLLSRYT